MSDVFISYSRHDREKAQRVAQRLEAQGFSVWWDREISPGETFDEVIEQALDAAGCVVVLWSKHSIGSSWVKTEAAEGARRGVLIPLRIDPVQIPLEFRRLQTVDLDGWPGQQLDAEFQKAVDAIRRHLSRTGETAQPETLQPDTTHPGSTAENAPATPESSALLHPLTLAIAVMYLAGSGLVTWLASRTAAPASLDSTLFLYHLILPGIAWVRFRETPFQVAIFCWVAVLVPLFTLRVPADASRLDYILGWSLLYATIAGVVWAWSTFIASKSARRTE